MRIRELFTPLQPTVTPHNVEVLYQDQPPNVALQDVIYCYWQLKTNAPLENEFVYRVVADGCIDIFFELNRPEENFVMGFCKKYTEFILDKNFHYIGIRFLPTMFTQLFLVPAHELSNRSQELELVLPDVAAFIRSRFDATMNFKIISNLLDHFFMEQLKKASFSYDNRLYEAIKIILKNYGVVDIKNDLDTGISPRQLHRLFDFYVGTSAKTFSQVVKFQNILKAKPSSQSLRENKLFYDVGYYDQSHFIKDFKNFYGVTPSKAFGR